MDGLSVPFRDTERRHDLQKVDVSKVSMFVEVPTVVRNTSICILSSPVILYTKTVLSSLKCVPIIHEEVTLSMKDLVLLGLYTWVGSHL